MARRLPRFGESKPNWWGAPPPIDERGSIGWHLFDVKTMLPVTIYRRQLSDELLALFDE